MLGRQEGLVCVVGGTAEEPEGGHYASAPPPLLFSCSSEANYVAKDKLELLFSFPEC